MKCTYVPRISPLKADKKWKFTEDMIHQSSGDLQVDMYVIAPTIKCVTLSL